MLVPWCAVTRDDPPSSRAAATSAARRAVDRVCMEDPPPVRDWPSEGNADGAGPHHRFWRLRPSVRVIPGPAGVDSEGTMDLHLFDLNLLVALDALLHECNVTQAGNRLNLSQPAMSGALARLRSHFQDELLVSVGRRMVRTPLGDELVEPVREILLQVRGTLEARSGFDPTTSTRHLTIAASDYVIAILMADALRRVRCEAPHVTFDLRPLGPRAVEALDNAELDFLIAPASADFEAHGSEVLFEDSFTCVAWSGNRDVGATLSPEEYLNLGHVVVNVGQSPVGNDDEVYLRKTKRRRRVEISTPSFFLAPQLVVGTDRITTITT